MLLCLPAAVALIVCADAFTTGIFQGGKMTGENTATMGSIVIALVCGLPAYVLIKVFQPAFFSREDTRTPVLVAAGALIDQHRAQFLRRAALRHCRAGRRDRVHRDAQRRHALHHPAAARLVPLHRQAGRAHRAADPGHVGDGRGAVLADAGAGPVLDRSCRGARPVACAAGGCRGDQLLRRRLLCSARSTRTCWRSSGASARPSRSISPSNMGFHDGQMW